jgi:hypothetical protein
MSGGDCRNLALQQMTSHEDMLKAFQLVVEMRLIYPAAEKGCSSVWFGALQPFFFRDRLNSQFLRFGEFGSSAGASD